MSEVDLMFWLSARYCVRQDAGAFLELWALMLVLGGAAAALRSRARAWSTALVACALLLFAAGASIFFGCSLTAAADQGQGWYLPPAWYAPLRCMGHDALSTSTGWCVLVISGIAAIALLRLGIARRNIMPRVFALLGGAVLLAVAILAGFGLTFAYSWCSSSRLF